MKKIISISAALALSLTLFAGCWGGSSSSSSSKPSASSSTSGSTSSSTSSSMSGSMSGNQDTTDSTLPGDVSGGLSDAGSGASDVLSGVGDGASDVLSGVGDGVSDMTGGASSSGNNMSSSASVAANAAAGDEAWALRLVNADNPLPGDFEVRTANIDGYEHRPFDMRAADQLNAMLRDAEKSGNQLYLVSAYRSVGRQKALFERKTAAFEAEGLPRAEAEKQAAQWVARPGTSEHNLGLAADIVSADWYQTHNDLTADFEQTPAFAWLKQHCAEYGFILRYPLGKESVTGVTYEPWHYRYVGKEAAKAIMDGGLTLEEYVAAR